MINENIITIKLDLDKITIDKKLFKIIYTNDIDSAYKAVNVKPSLGAYLLKNDYAKNLNKWFNKDKFYEELQTVNNMNYLYQRDYYNIIKSLIRWNYKDLSVWYEKDKMKHKMVHRQIFESIYKYNLSKHIKFEDIYEKELNDDIYLYTDMIRSYPDKFNIWWDSLSKFLNSIETNDYNFKIILNYLEEHCKNYESNWKPMISYINLKAKEKKQ